MKAALVIAVPGLSVTQAVTRVLSPVVTRAMTPAATPVVAPALTTQLGLLVEVRPVAPDWDERVPVWVPLVGVLVKETPVPWSVAEGRGSGYSPWAVAGEEGECQGVEARPTLSQLSDHTAGGNRKILIDVILTSSKKTQSKRKLEGIMLHERLKLKF